MNNQTTTFAIETFDLCNGWVHTPDTTTYTTREDAQKALLQYVLLSQAKKAQGDIIYAETFNTLRIVRHVAPLSTNLSIA